MYMYVCASDRFNIKGCLFQQRCKILRYGLAVIQTVPLALTVPLAQGVVHLDLNKWTESSVLSYIYMYVQCMYMYGNRSVWECV